MKIKLKGKVKRGICFDDQNRQYVANRMIIAPKVKASHCIKEIDFSNLANCSRIDRLAGSVPGDKLASMAQNELERLHNGGRIDLSKVESQGDFMATVIIQL